MEVSGDQGGKHQQGTAGTVTRGLGKDLILLPPPSKPRKTTQCQTYQKFQSRRFSLKAGGTSLDE
jgi:hypothetical protein